VEPQPEDLLDSSYYRPLRQLLEEMDESIARIYERAGRRSVRPRFAGPLLHLDRHGPSTVKALAQQTGVTHSAMSQTVAAMARAGLVELAMGTDARTRVVALTDEARGVLPLVRAEWRATEATVRELDAELPYPLMRVVGDLRDALKRKSFDERLIAGTRDAPQTLGDVDPPRQARGGD
jgi:DNA-binding MarR family transcriptional regulator